MSIRVRAVCTKSLSGISPEDLRAGIAERLPRLAAFYGEPDPTETIARLRVERAGPEGGGDGLLVRYLEGDARGLRVERAVAPAEVKAEVGALLADLEDCDEEEVDEVRDCLAAAVEIAAIELAVSDAEGVGWPVVIAAAATLAARGEGLVQTEAEGWLAPSGSDVEHLIDAD